jgi:hypothetical protein
VNLDSDTDQAIRNKMAEMAVSGGRSLNYSAAVREFVRECEELKAERDGLAVALAECLASKKGKRL